MKRWILAAFVFFVVLVGVWFWSLGALPAIVVPVTTLGEITGEVQVKAADAASFSSATSGEELHAGDTVKTGPTSSALIQFFNKAESKLDENTEYTILESNNGGANGDEPMQVRVRLEAGRVWSRVLQIFDLDGQFVAETSDVVATVRGTSFDLEKLPSEKTKLWVAESVVDASSAGNENAVFVAEGYSAEFGKGSSSTTGTQRLGNSIVESDWFHTNRAADKTFQDDNRNRLTESLALNRVPKAGLLKDVVRSSELLRERLASQASREALKLRYLLRKLAIIRRDVLDGNTGAALREYTRFENTIQTKVKNTADAKQVRKVLVEAHRLFIDVLPEDPAYRLKQQLEDLIVQLSDDSESEFTARFIGVKARLDESAQLFDGNNFSAAKSTARVAKTALENLSRELPVAKIDAGVQSKLMRVLLAYRVRTEALLQRIQEQKKKAQMPVLPSPIFVTSTDMLLSTTTTTTTTTEPQTGACLALRVSASPNPVSVGTESVITVQAVYADGHTADITKDSSIKTIGMSGALQGNVFIAAQAGSSHIEATASCGQETLTGSMDLSVNTPNLPVSLEISPSQGTRSFLQPISFQTRARYTNGDIRDVTKETAFQSSDERMGIQNGSIFTTYQLPGVVQITGTFTDQGVNVRASATVTIQAP
ncbi:hypothetical protein COX00_04565 [Candidatus Uhrbacteria bacterium CG22_combo_CG10-13_8_21_14_all_47_17]|uniref:FecR protein domain-containing protein n=1 Tax=Candidatus Uhrbacteria bacterium CG22_combo_CG10-13_8_21_14_all_47_17 TaxID=1975041 RepID=A0A2H0BSZ7_9BACT|nr:MAG: hypothetical protein COX00_04565 [Candidatus Uhrbacteria bacterium CG22_combo_CG10-13_8_21_14_all_47_17]